MLKNTFEFAPIKSVKPRGWLLGQLRIQADGLSGNLDKFWPPIADSKWIGGGQDNWEIVPYWLDGFIPLACLLDDADMMSRAGRYVDKILEGQCEDGWICPCAANERYNYDLWALFLILKALTVFHDATGDERIEPAVSRALRNLEGFIDGRTLFNWAHMRWFEALIPIFWLYERTQESWLVELAVKLRALGFDYLSLYENWPYDREPEHNRWSYMNHVVNNAMMIKAYALCYKITGQPRDKNAAAFMMELLDQHHGTVTGMFTGDECLSGRSPVQGTELCAVAELMYSLEHLSAITGEAKWGDRLESLAYNCLPATFSPDMWSHQYDQQVNQVMCAKQEKPVFRTNGGEAHLFGLQPNYVCCTANLSQAWPKFAASVFMKTAVGTAVTAYAPASLELEINGSPARLDIITDYPFDDRITVTLDAADGTQYPLSLRIPSWAEGATLSAGGEIYNPEAGKYFSINIGAGEPIELRLPMNGRFVPRQNGMTALVRGPLVYALEIGEDRRRVNEEIPGREFPHCDYEIYPTTPWNYAVADSAVRFRSRPVGDMPFSPQGAPVSAEVSCVKIDWQLERGSASPAPVSAVPLGEPETVRFIPYGCTNLRLTELPFAEKPKR
ncbi:MAG: glycoside hydrolase family 127 protein [Eubacteriales bacterium]|nr:glycoside hydrolase family 127 protein [Eubacteriales bacterium]